MGKQAWRKQRREKWGRQGRRWVSNVCKTFDVERYEYSTDSDGSTPRTGKCGGQNPVSSAESVSGFLIITVSALRRRRTCTLRRYSAERVCVRLRRACVHRRVCVWRACVLHRDHYKTAPKERRRKWCATN